MTPERKEELKNILHEEIHVYLPQIIKDIANNQDEKLYMYSKLIVSIRELPEPKDYENV